MHCIIIFDLGEYKHGRHEFYFHRLSDQFIETSYPRGLQKKRRVASARGLQGYWISAAVKMSQKIVLKVQLNCEKCVRRAMETLSGIEGVVSIAVDEKNKQITVIGDADPVSLTASLRKFGFAELVSVGPSKEPEKKPVPEKKPEAGNKQAEKKPEADKKQAEKKPVEEKASEKKAADKQEAPQQNFTYIILPTSCDHSSYTYYWSDENPNSCCIV